jgi:EpsI family protein
MMPISFSLPVRLALAAACLGITQFPRWYVEYQTGNAAQRATEFDVAQLPYRLAEWRGADTPLDELIFRNVRAMSMANRAYENDQGRRALVHVSSFAAAEMSLPHAPRLCYTNAGWSILDESWKRASDGRRFRSMIVERMGTRVAIGYWYQLADDVAADRSELRQALQQRRLHGERWPALVKVLLHVPVESTDAEALGVIEQVGGEVYAWVKENSST